MKIKISADTSCLINQDILEKNNISAFPLNVIIDGKEYLDGITINQDELKVAMENNKTIKTSTPPLGNVVEYFEKLFEEGYERIIHFTISSKLSSMFDLFTNVSKNYFDNKVIVIDSYSGSSLMLSHVLFANEEIKKGTDIQKICQLVEIRKQKNHICVVPKNLTTLKKGGRISPAIAAIGNTIGLKPVLALKEGELVKDSMTRHTKKVLIEKIDTLSKEYPFDQYDYTIIAFDANEAIVDKILEHILFLDSNYRPLKGLIPINICAHCGPGTLGLVVSPKINGKSLNEFI